MENFSQARLRVRPRPGEPAAALMARLALRNGYANPRQFGEAFKVRYDDVRMGRAIPELAMLSGLPEEDIAAWSPTFKSQHALVLRHQSLRYPYDWSIGEDGVSAKTCPACLRTDLAGSAVDHGPRTLRPYVRAWWGMHDVFTCPKHRCLLVARDERSLDRFWESYVNRPTERVRSRDLAADNYVLGRMGVTERILVPVLDDLSLGDASAVLTWLGELATSGTTPLDVRKMTFAEAARIRSEGLRLATNWPGRIYARLDSILDGAPSSARGLKGIYGRFYSRLYDDRGNRDSHEGRDLLKRVLEYHALGRVPFSEGETIFRKEPHNSLRVTIAHAAAICSVDAATMEAVVAAFRLAPGAEDRGRQEGIVRDDVEAVRDLLAVSIGSHEAADMLGIDAAEFAQLKMYGIVKPMLDRDDPLLDRYDRLDIERPMTWIASTMPADGVDLADCCAPMEIAKRSGLTFAEVVNALMLGNIRCGGFDPAVEGLRSVLGIVPDDGDIGCMKLDPTE